MPTNHRRIPIREKVLGLYYRRFQIVGPCIDSQIPARPHENSLFSSPVEKVGLIQNEPCIKLNNRSDLTVGLCRLAVRLPCERRSTPMLICFVNEGAADAPCRLL